MILRQPNRLLFKTFKLLLNLLHFSCFNCVELKKMKGIHRVNGDLDDWENILRIECELEISEHRVLQVVSQLRFVCEEL